MENIEELVRLAHHLADLHRRHEFTPSATEVAATLLTLIDDSTNFTDREKDILVGIAAAIMNLDPHRATGHLMRLH